MDLLLKLNPMVLKLLRQLNPIVMGFGELQKYFKLNYEQKYKLFGLYMALPETDVIAINETTPIEILDVVMLHELIHYTGRGSRLCRAGIVLLEQKDLTITEEHCQTEEAIAQLGMYKLGTYLGLDRDSLKQATVEYLASLPLADFEEAEMRSNEAVGYLVNKLYENKAA